jgi:DNA topoisomerase-3
LYERHKVLTYPRTDARALPEDYISTVNETLKEFKGTDYAPFAGQILKGGWVKPNKRIFDNSKISDHFAIIPTLQTPKTLNEAEAKIYDLVVRRFLAVFYPAAEYLQTTRVTEVEKHLFKTEGKVLVNPGWLTVYGRAAQGENENLPPVKQKEKVRTLEIAAQQSQTKAPARWSRMRNCARP